MYVELRGIEIYLNLAADHFLLPDIKILLQNKNRSGITFLVYFLHDF